MRSELLLERLALLVFEGDLRPMAMETSCQPCETEFGRHRHTVQLLEKGDDTAPLSAVFEADETKTESCQQGKLLGLSAVAEVQRNSSSLGKGQRRNFSSMTKVLSLILAAASEDLIYWKCVRTATRHWWRQWKAQAEKACEPPSGTGTI